MTPGKPDGTEVAKIYAGDRVSDLLNEASDKTLLVSNLASVQMLRVAELMDVPGICFVNGVEPEADVVELAHENGTLLMVSPAGVFETCGLIYQHLVGREPQLTMERLAYDIRGKDFSGAGHASRELKQHLKRIGAEADAVRRAMIAAYEAEMNVVIHADGGTPGGDAERRPARRRRRRPRPRHPRHRAGHARGLLDGLLGGARARASAPAWACPTSSATATACG